MLGFTPYIEAYVKTFLRWLGWTLIVSYVGISMTYFAAEALRGREPLSSVAFVVCDKDQGIVVTFHDGTQEFYGPHDPRRKTIPASLPDDNVGTLAASAPLCKQPPLKVY